MKESWLKYLVCPECKNALSLCALEQDENGLIKSGDLKCNQCSKTYLIKGYIPRFVSNENYASSFGLEWNKHSKTQYDSYTKTNISEKRFFEETNWPKKLTGELILEVGCGSGRFTEQLARTGANIISMDYSNSVEANYDSNGNKENVLILQANLYKMPFREGSFNKVCCLGVLQYTPDAYKSFMTLIRFLKTGGHIVADVYRKYFFLKQILQTYYWFRPITKRLKPEALYKAVTNYVNFMWPIARIINKLPLGRQINWGLLIADYRGKYDLREDILKEWAILDTFNILSPAYDNPQTLETVRQWCDEAKLINVDIFYGFNGVVARGIKP